MTAFFSSVPAMIVLTGMLVGLSGALLGTFLILRGSALAVDAISHAVLLGIILVWLVTGLRSGPLVIAGAALSGLAAVWLSEALARTGLVDRAAATGLVFPALFGAAILLVGLNARSIHIDAHATLLGEIGFVWLDTVELGGAPVPRAVLWLGVMLALNAGFALLFWKELKLSVFDPALASTMGLRPGLVSAALLALTSATAVAAFDAVGVILFIAFIIVPAATGRLLARSLPGMLAAACGVAIMASLAGHAAAMRLDASIAGMMALCAGALFCAALASTIAAGHWRRAAGRRAAAAGRKGSRHG
jgi:manganese/zinc/iron transport system permease protein